MEIWPTGTLATVCVVPLLVLELCCWSLLNAATLGIVAPVGALDATWTVNWTEPLPPAGTLGVQRSTPDEGCVQPPVHDTKFVLGGSVSLITTWLKA